MPDIAAKYAYDDAIIDHGNGEGVYAEVFCAVLESAAFVEHNIKNLIDLSLSYIPKDCMVYKSITLAMECYDAKMSWLEARDKILELYRGGFYFSISEEDIKKGFDKANVGVDVAGNLGMTIIGLLYGNNDFEKIALYSSKLW